ncbi:MAG: tetratricopeptide repeat protein [Pirellulales bacterium]
MKEQLITKEEFPDKLKQQWGACAKEPEAYVLLVGLLRRTKPTSKAEREELRSLLERTMDGMIEANPESAVAYLERARFRRKNVHPKGGTDQDRTEAQEEAFRLAREDVAKALSLEATDADVLIEAADVAMLGKEKNLDAAAKYLETGVREHPKDSRMYQRMADLARQRRDLDAALAHISEGLEYIPNDPLLLSYKADIQLQQNDLEAVRNTLKTMDRPGIPQVFVEFLRARVSVVEGDWIDAANRLTEIRPDILAMARSNTYWASRLPLIQQMLGQCYENMGKYDKALDEYQRALDMNRQLTTAQLGVERMKVRTGQGPAAGTKTRAPDGTVLLPIEERVQAFADKHPGVNEFGLKLYEAQLLVNGQQYDQAAEMLKKLAKRHAEDARLWAALIRTALKNPDQGYEEALKLVRQARTTVGDSFPMDEETVWIGAVEQVARDEAQGPAEALELLEKAQTQLGDTIALRAVRASLLWRQGVPDIEQQLKKTAEGLDKWSEEEQVSYWARVWVIYLQAGMTDQARQALQRVAAVRPTDLKVRTMLFNLALNARDVEGMKKEIETIRQLKEETVWRYAQASLNLYLAETEYAGTDEQKVADRTKLLNETQEVIDAARKMRPDWHELYRLQAEVNLLRKQYEDAITNFYKAFELGPANPVAVRQLYALLVREGRVDDAQRVLRDYLGDEQQAGIAPERRAETLVRSSEQNERERGLKIARSTVERDPNNPKRQLWYAQILLQAGEMAKAEAPLRKAVDLGPEMMQPWLALVRYLAATKRSSDAEAVVRKARLELRPDHLPLFLAQSYDALGMARDAEQYYQVIAKSDPDNLAYQQAVAKFYLTHPKLGQDNASRYLNAILKSPLVSSDRPPAQVAWARRMAARVLASSGDYRKVQAGIKMIRKNEVQGKLSPADRLESAHILAVRPEPSSQQEAVRLLEDLNSEGGLKSNDRLTMARLYFRAGKWRKCRQMMDDLLVQQPKDPATWAVYCQMLLERDELSEASRRLRRLEKLAPDGLTTHELKARLLAKQGDTKQAVAALRAALPKKVDAKQIRLLVRIASVLTEIEQYEIAEKLYRKMADLEPRAQVALASFLAQHGDMDEAFDLLDPTAQKRSIGIVLQIATSAVNSRRDEVGDRYDARIESWIDGAERDNPGSVMLVLQRALLREGQGRFDEVVQIYEQLLARDDLKGRYRAAILNNLAYVLALQDQRGKDALQFIIEAIDLMGPTADLLDTRGMAKLVVDNPEGAVEDLKLAIAGGATSHKLFHLAIAQMEAGHPAEARKALQKAEKLGLKADKIRALEKKKYSELIGKLGVQQARRAG